MGVIGMLVPVEVLRRPSAASGWPCCGS